MSLSWALPDGARAHLTHLNLPGVADYTERVTVFCRDRILELSFPSPYLRFHPTELVEKRSGAGPALRTTHHRVSYEESFRNELRAFHASVTTGAPVRASAEAAREDLNALLTAAADGREGGGLMRVGLFTDGLQHLSRRDAFAWCVEHGITDVEMSVGPWGARTHLDLDRLLADAAERAVLARDLAEFGLTFSAVNAAGNPLHPDPAAREEAQSALRGAVELARVLDVDRVITMAGCPGGRTGGPIGVFGLWSTSNDDEGLWAWQMAAEVGPYWRKLSDWAAATAPDVRICLELHPGVSVYSVETYRALRTYAAANVLVNLDPSHFWWQGADPVRVIGELSGVIGWAHGKDTTIYPDRVALRGVLDPTFPPDPASSSWHFSAVGDGHDLATWRASSAPCRTPGTTVSSPSSTRTRRSPRRSASRDPRPCSTTRSRREGPRWRTSPSLTSPGTRASPSRRSRTSCAARRWSRPPPRPGSRSRCARWVTGPTASRGRCASGPPRCSASSSPTR